MQKYYVIKVDYFSYDETKPDGIGRSPMYLFTTRNKQKVYIFKPTLNQDYLDLKWFETEGEAKKYIKAHLGNSFCYDNVRVEEVNYTL